MSKMGQYFMDLPYDETPLGDDPEYQIWADNQDEEDIETQDNNQEEEWTF